MPKKINLSAVIIAKDEAAIIKDCLESVKWAQEIVVVVDDRTQDSTAQICRAYTDKIFFHKFVNLTKQRQFAIKKARGEWIFFIDADERCPLELKKEILQKITNKNYAGWLVYRHGYFLGKSFKPKGMGCQPVIGLFRKNKGYFLVKTSHEQLVVRGRLGTLKAKMIHHSHRTVSQTITKFNVMTSWEAQELYQAGGRTSLMKISLSPWWGFYQQYWAMKSYRYGVYGFIQSLMCGLYYLIKHLKWWELGKK